MRPPSVPANAPAYAVAMLKDLTAWVGNLTRLPQKRKVYTVATLPPAADFDGATVPVSDGTSNKPTVTSVGGVWRYPDGVAA